MFPLSPRVLHSWFPCICIIQEKEGFGKAYLIQSLNIISGGDKKVATQGQRFLCKQQIWKEQDWRQLMKRQIINNRNRLCISGGDKKWQHRDRGSYVNNRYGKPGLEAAYEKTNH